MPAPKPSSQPSRRPVSISLPASSRIAIAILTARSAGSGIGTESFEEHHDPVARELADERPQRAVVFAQEIEHFLGLGGLGKRRVAAQIAKYDDDLAAAAFEDV